MSRILDSFAHNGTCELFVVVKYFTYLALALFVFTSCKQEDEEDPITSMEIRIQDQDGVSITDAINVYLYTDLVQYNTAKSNENVHGTSFYTSGISLSGSVTFDNVDPSLTYFVFIKYNSNGYDLTNYFSQYEI